MTVLDRYIGVAFAQALLLAVLALVLLFTILDFVQQLDDVGNGRYGLHEALRYELQMLPRRTLDLLPFGALVAAVAALAVLAHHSELNALRASGVSKARIALALAKSAVVLIVLMGPLAEFIAFPLQQTAVRERSLAISDNQVLEHEGGFWMHRNDRFVHIGRVLHGRVPADVDILELGSPNQLRSYTHANQVDIVEPQRWRLKDLIIKRIDKGSVATDRAPMRWWESYLSDTEIGLMELTPDSMSANQLVSYVDYLRRSGQASARPELSLWRKLTQPLWTGTLMLLAVPFFCGSPRSHRISKRILLVLAIGLGFQILSQVTINLGLILELSPVVTVLAPLLMVLAFTLLMSKLWTF